MNSLDIDDILLRSKLIKISDSFSGVIDSFTVDKDNNVIGVPCLSSKLLDGNNGVFTCDAHEDFTLSPHCHSFPEYIIIISGKIYILEQSHIYTDNEFVYIPKDEVHTIYVEKGTKMFVIIPGIEIVNV